MKVMFFLTVVIMPFVLFGQDTISGKVRSVSGFSIPSASVYLVYGIKKTKTLAVVSDSMGKFAIPIVDSFFTSGCFIYSTYLNHKSDTIAINDLTRFYDIKIAVSEVLLPDVIVESNAPIIQRMADRFIFTPNKLLSQGASALDVLKFAPLVQFDEKTSFFSIINKEGTIIYINNRKSNMPKEMIISILRSASANDIKNIEIITNPGSEYPANTSGGVININLKRMFDEGWSGNLMASSEQAKFNTSILNGAINYRKEKVGVRISPFLNNSFNYNTTENLIIKDPKHLQMIRSDMYRRYKVLGSGLGVDYDINKNNLLSFNGFYSTVNGKSESSNQTSMSDNDFQTADSLYSSPVKGTDQYTYNFGNVYYQHNFDSLNKRTITINVDYNQFYQERKNDGQFITNKPQGIYEEIGNYTNNLPQKFFNLSERVDYTAQLKDNSKINIGVQYSNTSVSNNLQYLNWDYGSNSFLVNQDLTNNYNYRETYFAGYLSYTKSFNKKLNGIFGLRAEQINYSSENVKDNFKADTNYLSLFPSLSLSYVINKKNNISLSLSKKIRRPDIELLFPGRTFYNQEYLQENNPFLQPVISYSSEAMYGLRNKYFFTAGYNLFKNQYSQFIISLLENGNEKLKKTYLNYGNVSTTYFSFFTQQNFVKQFWDGSISMNVNYSNYREQTQAALFYTKDIRNLNYNLMWNNTFYISNKGKWIGFAIFKYYSLVKNIAYERINGLFSADLGLRKTIKNFSGTLYLSDVFNTNGRSKLVYNPNPAFSYNYLNQNSYTQRIALSIRYSFGNNKLRQNKNKKSANEEIQNRIAK